MASSEASFSFSVASVVEDVLQQHGHRLQDLDLESRKAQQAASRRYEAAGWLRKMVGVVAAKDLPAEPSEEEFRLGLRSGIILCNVINKFQSGAVPKVVESPVDSALIPDGAPLSAYQYFENVRNFLVAVQEIGLPTFEASDLEQGGKSSRIVNCVLALKSYGEWKQNGANGVWKFGGNLKPTISAKSLVRKNSEPFTNSLSRTSSINEKTLATLNSDVESNKMSSSHSLSMLVRSILSDKNQDEIPMLVESVLNKVVEEFEHRIASQGEQTKVTLRDHVSERNGSAPKFMVADKKVENKIHMVAKKEDHIEKNRVAAEELQSQHLKQQMLFDQQQRDIQELKLTLHTTKAGMQFMQMKFRDEFTNLGTHIRGLAHAASGYHRVLEENRKLYNEVQDLKGSIRVYCRVRPFFPGQRNQFSAVENIEDETITVSIPSRNGKGQRSFNFNKVFGSSATQAEVFLDMQPLIRSVLDGYNVCIFAYGQTGSGKTYTMTGPKEITEKSQGVNYRALSDLFMIADQRKDTFHYDVYVQMIEIYNEQVRDLLVTDGTNRRLEIRSSSHKGLSVPDASLVSVSSTFDVIDLMNLGHRNRAVGATALNDRSSRSHSCLTVHVQGRDLTSGATTRGCMHLVDLAGSERVDKSEATGDRLKEAQHINKSLSALGDVIASLAHKNSHVPYRNSKLTQLLQDSLGGQAKTLMFVHISPESDAIGETISTLKFAERVATVELGAARVNKDGANVKELKEQIASLKAALARKEGEPEHSFSGSSEKYRTKASEPSPYHINQRVADTGDQLGCRRPMVEVGNIELQSKTVLRQKTQSFDFDEISANSPPWPPVNSLGQDNGEDEKETGSGEWVDKVMVKKLEANKTENLLGCWQESNGNLSESFYQTYLQDSSKMYSEQSYNMFMGGNQFNSINMGSDDNTDEVDAITSDSSEPDLLWQFNHSKLSSLTNGIGTKAMRSVSKATKSPELSKSFVHSSLGPSPSLKQSKVVSHRTGRSPAPVDMKRKIGRK
ncbi:kinesin-like protein KIN-14I isoform X1 [Medicago truncatula]|uniref:P-loop nucleoside triphosphate hydrolase superfamily protein n=3 Tax=Medicago truncatula TaxID=3880 RepID=A0A072UF61_MEDTR|nr:kinesin-like protein KIN-14I isoform X1 [Medicago truncatula]KEH24415.1 P-loop nucleoside triphosphate hydrolase superfamily protein [Medicago truncatula]